MIASRSTKLTTQLVMLAVLLAATVESVPNLSGTLSNRSNRSPSTEPVAVDEGTAASAAAMGRSSTAPMATSDGSEPQPPGGRAPTMPPSVAGESDRRDWRVRTVGESSRRRKEPAVLFALPRDEAEPGFVLRLPNDLTLELHGADGELHQFPVNRAIFVKYAKALATLLAADAIKYRLDATKCSATAVEALVHLITCGLTIITPQNAAELQTAGEYFGIESVCEACGPLLDGSMSVDQCKQRQLQQLRQLIPTMEAELARSAEIVANAQPQLDELETQRSTLAGQLDEALARLSADLGKQIGNVADEIAALNGELERIEANKVQLTAELADVKGRNARKLTELRAKREQVKHDHGQAAENLSKEIVRLEIRENECSDRIQDLIKANLQMAEKIRRLPGINDGLSAALDKTLQKLEARTADVQTQLNQRKAENVSREAANGALAEQLDAERTRLAESERQRDALRQALQEQTTKLDEQRQAVQTLIKEGRERPPLVVTDAEALEKLRGEVQQLEMDIEKWQRENSPADVAEDESAAESSVADDESAAESSVAALSDVDAASEAGSAVPPTPAAADTAQSPANCNIELTPEATRATVRSRRVRVRNTTQFWIGMVKESLRITGLAMDGNIDEMRAPTLRITEQDAGGAVTYEEYVLVLNAAGNGYFLTDNQMDIMEHPIDEYCSYRLDLCFMCRSPNRRKDWTKHHIVDQVKTEYEVREVTGHLPGDNETPAFVPSASIIKTILLVESPKSDEDDIV